MNGIFGNHVFSGFGQIGLGLIDLDKARANLLNSGATQTNIDNVLGWAQKVNSLEAGGMTMPQIMNSTTDATYAHYRQALSRGVKLTAEQSQAIAYEARAAEAAARAQSPSQVVTIAPPVSDELTKGLAPETGLVASKSNLPLILGGTAAAAVIGGLIWWKFGRKKAAAA